MATDPKDLSLLPPLEVIAPGPGPRDPDNYRLDRSRLHNEPKRTFRMPDQRSVTDQLQDLIKLAHQNGLYDAADWVMARMSVK